MVSKDREGNPGSPSSPWEIPAHAIRVAERILTLSGIQQSESKAGLHRGVSGVYLKLLAEANARQGFQAGGNQGEEVKHLNEDYALEVFRRPDGEIFALRLGMATEEPLQFGSIYFSVLPGLQRPQHVEVNDRLTRINENGLTIQSTRKLLLLCGEDEIVHFNLNVHTNSSFTSKPVSFELIQPS